MPAATCAKTGPLLGKRRPEWQEGKVDVKLIE